MGTEQNFEIKLVDGNPELFSGGTQITDHEFGVPAGECYVFTFKIAFVGAEEMLRFRRPGDPPPGDAISWNDKTDPPPSVQPIGPTHEDKELVITVTNPCFRKEELATSFTLYFFHPASTIDASCFRVDPTIIEKPDEPVPDGSCR